MPRIIGFDPIVFEDSRILILGSMPSVISLHQQMYYANPTNRFWPVLSAVTRHPVQSDREKLDCLKKNQIALWDVCASCRRQGSMDAAIKEMVVNDIPGLLKTHPKIQTILCNGTLSAKTMKQFFPDIPVVGLPSTSAANARWKKEDLIREYGKRIGER